MEVKSLWGWINLVLNYIVPNAHDYLHVLQHLLMQMTEMDQATASALNGIIASSTCQGD